MAAEKGLQISYDDRNVIVDFGKYSVDENGDFDDSQALQTFGRDDIGRISESTRGDYISVNMNNGASYFLTTNIGVEDPNKRVFLVDFVKNKTDPNNVIDVSLTDKRSLTLAVSDIRL